MATTNSVNTEPVILAPDFDKIPLLLRNQPRWIVWKVGKPKPGGRYDKIPLNQQTGTPSNAHDSSIWLSFDDVTTAYTSGKFSGIGFVLDGKPVCQDADGCDLYLVGIDIDECIQTNGDGKKSPSLEAKVDWKELGKPYLELSPSGTGVRAFMLSRKPLPSNSKNKHEVYCDKRFLTITGHTIGGIISEGTEALVAIYDRWFPDAQPIASIAASTLPSNLSLGSNLVGRDFACTPENIKRITQGLKTRTKDAGWNDREKWLATMFAVRSLHRLASWPEDKVWKLFNDYSKWVNGEDTHYDESGNRKLWDAPERNDGKRITFASILGDAKLEIPAPLPLVNTSNTPSPDGAGQAWPMPQPLTERIEAEPYPIDALPDTIRAAVEEVGGFVKAPVPLVASSAIAALSLAIQPHADVQRADKLHSPVCTFTLVIADSGERKSTCDGFFTKAIRDYESSQVEAAKPCVKDYNAAISAWDAKHNGIKDKIRRLAKDKKPTAELENDLRDLEHNKPKPPRIPRLIYGDVTPEELAYKLANDWPSGGVVSAEAGVVFGSHGMGKDSVTRNLARLNVLWDGGDLPIDRRTTESFTVRGARLTMGLQVQSATLLSFFEKSGALARGTGFLARFLIAWPESTQGYRPFTEAPEHWPSLAAFNRRITEVLNMPVPINDDGSLTPLTLTLTPGAKAAWIAYHDAIEGELASGGELFDVRDVASKSADNAARLAALFHIFEGGLGAIGADAFERASRIAAWHLNESRRFFGALALPVEMADAARLDRWLIEHCRQGRTHCVGKRYTRQHGTIRDGARLDVAISELVSLDRIQVKKEGKQLSVWLNPTLMAEDGVS